jgi:hypothetical protein
LLAEAKLNLSVALLCKQKTTDGMRFFRAGLVRQSTINPDGTVTAPPIDQQLDTSHGTQATLPPIPIPDTWQGMVAAVPLYQALDQTAYDRLVQRGQRDSALRTQIFAENLSPLTQNRELAIIGYEISASKPQVDQNVKLGSDSYAAAVAVTQGLNTGKWNSDADTYCNPLLNKSGYAAFQACFTQKYNEECSPDLDRAQVQIVDIAKKEDQADRDFIARWYPWASGVVANVGDQATHERYSGWLEETVDDAYYQPVKLLGFWAGWVKNSRCGQPAPDVPATPDAPTTPHSEACPPSLKGVKLSWKLGGDAKLGVPFDLAVDINCEKVSVEASAPIEGWFGVFGSLDYSPRSGKTTVFAGPKLGAKIPGTSLGASFKDGLYLSFDRQGHATDFGFRTSVSSSAAFGPFSIKGAGESMDFSFAPVFGITH